MPECKRPICVQVELPSVYGVCSGVCCPNSQSVGWQVLILCVPASSIPLQADEADEDEDEELDFDSMTEEEKEEIMNMLSPEEREAFQQLLNDPASHGAEL